jgi:hypothetical protein
MDLKCHFCNSELTDHSKDICYSQRIHCWSLDTTNALKDKIQHNTT